MINEIILQLFERYGYLIFFLAFSLGPFGVPVPNEMTLLTGGFLSSKGILNPWIIYCAILLGFLTAITIAFFAGRLFGETVKARLQTNRYFKKAEKLLNKYGEVAMCLGLLVPVARYLVPVFVGFNGVSFKRFALISYSSALVWTSVLFACGRLMGRHISNLIRAIDPKLLMLAVIIVVCALIITKRTPRSGSNYECSEGN